MNSFELAKTSRPILTRRGSPCKLLAGSRLLSQMQIEHRFSSSIEIYDVMCYAIVVDRLLLCIHSFQINYEGRSWHFRQRQGRSLGGYDVYLSEYIYVIMCVYKYGNMFVCFLN